MAALRRLSGFYVGLLAALFACVMTAPVAAQSGPANYGATVTGVRVAAGGNATTTINMVRNSQGVYVAEKYAVSGATLGRLAGSAVRGLSGAATAYTLAKAVVEGAGWAIDELQKQVVDGPPGGTKAPMQPGETVYCISPAPYAGINLTHCTANLSDVCPLWNRLATNWTCTGPRANDPTRFDLVRTDATGSGSFIAQRVTYQSTYVNSNPTLMPSPVPLTDLGNAFKNSGRDLTPLFYDPRGNVIDHEELRQAVNKALTDWAAQNGDAFTPPQLPPIGVDVTPAPGTGSSTGTDTGSNGGGTALEFPRFCDWATVVCDFIDWYKEEPDMDEPEVPEEDLAMPEQGWSSGLASSAACPAPVGVSIDYLGHVQPIEFSYEPICGVLQLLRPVIIAIGALLAALVLAGRRTDSA